ncbi:HAD-IB family hydrolase [Sphingomonas sp. AOB5]|uniref:HAD family hydrolase n=1 Tax=Sphingomonas sp. AOB5 TaxID=3034017 RepID=UPI0023F94DF1|nr:HAD-IB family hydrolase [Sphingomonas sp. AOB5]MDF7776172.1 HAD-IB family hydrolase [Sphingomonas sp. AOB5]
MQRLAIYDMDKTITRAPTWTAFLLHAAKARAPWRLALFPAAAIAGAGYMLKLVDRAGLKQIAHRMMIGKALPEADLRVVADAYADAVMAGNVLAPALARIAEDKAAGYRLVLATASHGYYAAAIGARLGFDDVIATVAKRDDAGRVLSEIEGENCYGPAKLRMVEAWLAGQGIAREDAQVRAYSDHVSDAPLLEWADEAFAVNAHAPLVALAGVKGWPVLDWR